MRRLSAKWVPKCLNADQKVNGASRLSNFWNFFGAIQMISCHDWWPWTKPGYITMTRRQSNNQWSGGIAAHATPKNSECKNPLENFSPRFLKSRRHPHHWLSSKGLKYQRGVLLISVGVIVGHFEGKTPSAGSSPKGSCSCKTMPRLTGHLQPRRNWPTWASRVLITHPIVRIWSRRTTTCSLDWKKIERSPFFVRRGGHCSRGDLVERNFFQWVAKVRATGWEVYWASWRVCWINPEFGRCSSFPSWSG